MGNVIRKGRRGGYGGKRLTRLKEGKEGKVLAGLNRRPLVPD
jgi:hypothetical protein